MGVRVPPRALSAPGGGKPMGSDVPRAPLVPVAAGLWGFGLPRATIGAGRRRSMRFGFLRAQGFRRRGLALDFPIAGGRWGEEARRLVIRQAFVIFVVLGVVAAAGAAGHAPSPVLGDRPPDRDVAQFSSAGVVVDSPRVLRAQNRCVDDGVFERFSEFFGRAFGSGRITAAVTRNRPSLAFCIFNSTISLTLILVLNSTFSLLV